MSRKDVDQNLVQAAFVFRNTLEGGQTHRAVSQFKQSVQLLRETGTKLPWDSWEDPGAHYEYDFYLKYVADGNGSVANILNEPLDICKRCSPHDLRLIRARESLRDACHLAHTPKRGFKGIGRPPELQQLVAASCIEAYACHLLYPTVWGVGRGCRLLARLSPHLRITLLAEVAAGILCPRYEDYFFSSRFHH